MVKNIKKTNNKNNNHQWKDICSMVYLFGGNNKLIDGILQNYSKLGYTFKSLMKCLPFMFIGI